MLTKNQICSYGCIYNWLNDTPVNEVAKDYFYKHIAFVNQQTLSITHSLLGEGKKIEHSQGFLLQNVANDSIMLITNDVLLKTSSEITTRIDKTVQQIRTMLRSVG